MPYKQHIRGVLFDTIVAVYGMLNFAIFSESFLGIPLCHNIYIKKNII